MSKIDQNKDKSPIPSKSECVGARVQLQDAYNRSEQERVKKYKESNSNLPKQHQQMQAELYARIDAQHRKDRDASLVFKLKIILFAAVVLIACISVSKCQGEQAAQQKEQELKQTIECK